MLLSRPHILKHIELKNIVIEPFNEKNLGNSGYDVTLGRYYWRKIEPKPEPGGDVFNPFDPDHVYNKWSNRHHTAQPLRSHDIKLKNISPDDLVIWLKPGETILAHTEEFIGGLSCVSTKMHARSTTGRNDITVCRCAGKGDVGYINRWTMEITNNDCNKIPLVVGRRYSQIEFYEVCPLSEKDQYHQKSDTKYQPKTVDLQIIKADWSPEDMLPKMWKDREVGG